MAAPTAERLAAGRLDQRMEVRGEDDLAPLAASFNEMAANLQRQIQPAGGALPGAAAVRLRRLARAAHPADHDPDGRRRDLQRRRDDFDPAVARSAELLQAELDRFEGLLTDLLEISRFDAGRRVLDVEPADLAPWSPRVVDRLQPLAERGGVAVEVDAAGRAGAWPRSTPAGWSGSCATWSATRSSTARASRSRSRWPRDEGAVAVAVRDHGVGLARARRSWSSTGSGGPTRRGPGTTGGTGLGLSIALEDARLHGGWLQAWGEPGQGAQFRLTLPSRAGDRLTSSPLRLVPTDFRPPTEAVPEPRLGKAPTRTDGTPRVRSAGPASGPEPDRKGRTSGTDRGQPAVVGEGGRDDG